jgi:hypothetical protein
MPHPITKTCKICADPFVQRDDEHNSAFRKRQTCSKECRDELHRANSTKSGSSSYSNARNTREEFWAALKKKWQENPPAALARAR